MVTSSSQLSGAANSSVDHPGVHQSSRNLNQSQNDPPSRSSAMPRPAPTPADQPRSHQQSPSSGPSVVSRYVLPTYRQANSSSPASSMSPHNTSSNPAIHPLNASLPDILHSHMVPQIPRLRQNQRRPGGDHRQGRERHRSEADGSRHRHAHHGSRGDRRRTQSSSSQTRESCLCKEPCVKCVVTLTSFRWVLVVLSILGVCCVVSGIVLAALHAAGSSFLFLAVMFIGLGILLVIVVSVGWKCTPRGHEPLHALFHIGQFGRGGSRERHRRRRHRHRDGNWFGGVFYPEFQYRRPPPSYAASMQDYQNHSLQELSSNPHANTSRHERHDSLPGSPPPSYHSRTSTIHSGMNITVQGDSLPNSRPPTYRSRAPSRRPSLPRHESESPQQGTETASDPSLPTNDHHSEFVNVTVADEIVTESGNSRDLTSAGDVTVSYSSTAEPYEQHRDRDTPDASATPSSPHTNNVMSPGADDSNNIITTNQNGPSVIEISSDRRDSTIVVVSNQPPSSLPLPPPTSTASSESFISPRLPPSSPGGDNFNFHSDVHQLEQALEPLDMMDESSDDRGIDNLGASISSDSTEHYDTHL